MEHTADKPTTHELCVVGTLLMNSFTLPLLMTQLYETIRFPFGKGYLQKTKYKVFSLIGQKVICQVLSSTSQKLTKESQFSPLDKKLIRLIINYI